MIPDFRGINSLDEIRSRFLISAQSIMFDHDLVFDKRPMRITALELYLNCGAWADPNTDMNSEQLNSGTWYVRRRGTNANTSRIDITAGCASENFHCGLLVRGIDGIDGSGKAIKRILRGDRQVRGRSWLAEEIETLDEISGRRVEEGLLQLVHREKPLHGAYSLKPRVGLRYPEAPWNENLRIVAEQV